MLQLLSQLQCQRVSIFPDVWQRSSHKLNHMLHQARRYFHDDNGLPDLEALKNIYQVVAQQLLNSRERYMKKHHKQKPVKSPMKPGDLVLMVNHAAKAFEPKYKKETYRVVKVNGNQEDIRDYRGNIFMVHITDVKKTTLTDEVADDYIDLCKEERFVKKCVPRGYIPDLNWTTIHNDQNQASKTRRGFHRDSCNPSCTYRG